jgi:Zn-dependent peptidase ImmA (M78 family)
MATRVEVSPTLLAWASERSGRDPQDLEEKFPKLGAWARGDIRPTLKQLEKFARATDTPVGFLLLSEPPEERLPVPDFRTIPRGGSSRPSPNLLDTIFLCEQRQDWYRDYLRSNGADRLEFVGSLGLKADIAKAAAKIQTRLDFGLDARREMSSWSEALREFAERAEDAGILVMINGVVGSNTHRTLDPDEFRGFALVDSVAPIVFVNGADTKAAQIFTLAHELAHVWLGRPALSNARLDMKPNQAVERWCNAVAAELLVPMKTLRAEFVSDAELQDEVSRLARLFRVSTLVLLRRVFDAGYLNWGDYQAAFEQELSQIKEKKRATGGDFYKTQPVRTSKRFTRAVVADTLEGRTLHRDAFQMLGIRKHETFTELGERLGVL